MTVEDVDLPEVVELSEQESDWVFWGHEDCPGATPCKCGHHEGMGPDWHERKCPAVLNAWKHRAKELHDEVWRLRRKLNGEPEPDLGFSIDSRCGCGKHPDHEPVRFHRRGSSGCRAAKQSGEKS